MTDDDSKQLPDSIKATITGEAARESQLGENAASVPGGAAGKIVRPRKPGKVVCAVCGLAPGTCSHQASLTTTIEDPDDEAEE